MRVSIICPALSAIPRIPLISLALIPCSFFVSCGNFNASAFKPSNIAKKSAKSIAKLMPSRVPVTEVREKDLKKMPSGADRALAWDTHLDSKRYASASR